MKANASSDMEQLVHEALNLVVRARNFDKMVLGQACVEAGSYHPDHINCGTPHLWLMDQYDTDLAAWEAKAKSALQGTGEEIVTEWTDKDLKVFCREFRKGMLGRMSSKGKCAMVTWALQGFLSFSLKLKTKVYEGDVGEWNHLWLVMPNGAVIDCTADQFGKKYPQVYIGEPLSIHKGGKPYVAKL